MPVAPPTTHLTRRFGENNGLLSSGTSQPTMPSHDGMTSIERKVRMGNYNRRSWRSVRRKLEKMWKDEECSHMGWRNRHSLFRKEVEGSQDAEVTARVRGVRK